MSYNKFYVAREESSEFVFIPHIKMLFMRDPNGKVVHQHYEAVITGQSFEIFLNVEGNNQSVKFKEADQPIWSIKYITKQEQKNMLFPNPTPEENIKSLLVGKDVEFRTDNGEITKGIVYDKVNIPIATNPPRGYCPMDNYLIMEDTGILHIVNPINLKMVLPK